MVVGGVVAIRVAAGRDGGLLRSISRGGGDMEKAVRLKYPRSEIPVEAPKDLIDECFMKCRVLDGSREHNRKLSKRSARTLQSMLEYKLKWLGLSVRHVDAKNTSKTCPPARAT
jgi:transposase